MSSETEAAQVIIAEAAAQASSPTSDSKMSIGDEDMKLVEESVRSLPSHAVKDLLSAGVCMRYIFRLLGVQGHVFFSSSRVPSAIGNMLGEPLNDPSTCKESEVEQELCSICLGILQFIYCDDKGVLVKKDNAVSLSLSIAEVIKQRRSSD